ncbi:MAG TPA: hypothetical protein QGF58_02335 [Myxococcota bacterium]|nr:hypothetical protein [Myxococcota bacterium]
MEFVSTYDAEMAASGPAGIFLRDPDGLWKFDSDLSRDCWARAAPLTRDPGFGLMRDRASGFNTPVYVTGRGIFDDHPRLDVTWYADLPAMLAALSALGSPPCS